MADDDLPVSRGVRIPRRELVVSFSASGGPGGQHANKTATRVELVFDVEHSPSLLPVQRARVLEKLGPVIRIVVDEERSQLRNRALAEERFVARLAQALHVEAPAAQDQAVEGREGAAAPGQEAAVGDQGQPAAAPPRRLSGRAEPARLQRAVDDVRPLEGAAVGLGQLEHAEDRCPVPNRVTGGLVWPVP